MHAMIGQNLVRSAYQLRNCSNFLRGLRYPISPILGYQNNFRLFHLSSVFNGQVVQFNLSDIGEGIAEVQIKEWFVKPGDKIAQFDSLCEVQSDKASVTITSRYDGVVKKLYYTVDDIAQVGKTLVDIELEGEDDAQNDESSDSEGGNGDAGQPQTSPSPSPSSPPPSGSSEEGKALATPSVRRIAKEHNIELRNVKGTGKDGRILKEDVLAFIGIKADDVEKPSVSSPARPQIVVQKEIIKEDKTVPIRGYSRIMMKTMSEANHIPHFGYNDEVNVNKLVDLRDQLKFMAKERGVKMTFMPLFIKAASLALLEHPILNASLDKSLENIIYKSSHNICVAMDTPLGLIVPTIKNVEEKNLWEIANDLMRIHEAGRRGSVAQDDLKGGTFTLSNIGAIGGTYASPVIMPPQVAIGALGQIKLVPRYTDNGDLEPTHTVKISWAADHRVIDGATMARFSNLWKQYLENPGLMIANMK